MSESILNIDNLDAFQRLISALRPLPDKTTFTSATVAQRRTLQITGVGRMEKLPQVKVEQDFHVLSEDLFTGLYGYMRPLAFEIRGTTAGISIQIGTWNTGQSNSTSDIDSGGNHDTEVIESVLRTIYQVIDVSEVESSSPINWGSSGLALGIPSIQRPDKFDGALPLDRAIRAMSGSDWIVLLLAYPVPLVQLSNHRTELVEQLRVMQAEAQSLSVPNPMAEQFANFAKEAFKNLTSALTVGAWRTAIYLLGDKDDSASYARLASVWQSVFGGADSQLDPVRIFKTDDVKKWAARWAMPNFASLHDHHPYEYQTLLTSTQLASYIHLPNLETNGFSIRTIPDFDVSVPPVEKNQFSLGFVLQRELPIAASFSFSLDALTKHAFVCGVTGGGKTNTILHILKQAGEKGIPFLVIEPAKTEYRSLLCDSNLGTSLRVYTLSKEMVAPLRLNPFEVPAGISVATHVDMLRSAFATGFGMWSPLPQILERCLYQVYEEAGWDFTTGVNSRLPEGAASIWAYPTLSDLVDKVDSVTQSLGYDEKVTGDMKAALLTRIESLRTGGKGAMLDGNHSLDFETLLQSPTILELEGLGDEDDKALLMSLFLIRLVEHRRVLGMRDGLNHIMVIEEAHRLLANSSGAKQQGEADPKGKAVETFANLLAEIRAYGQGIIIADQVPVKLAPDVIKNTNLKIVHRIVAEDDRKVMAGAMAMNDRQTLSLSTLRAGEAIVFKEGEDNPVMIKVDSAKIPPAQCPTDFQIKRIMSPFMAVALPNVIESLKPTLLSLPGDVNQRSVNQIVETEAFHRLFVRYVLSAIESSHSATTLFQDLVWMIRSLSTVATSEALTATVLTKAAFDLGRARGRQNQWSYPSTMLFVESLQEMLIQLTCDCTSEGTLKQVFKFQKVAHELHSRKEAPFEFCTAICSHASECMYRYWVAEVIDRGNLDEDARSEDQMETALNVAYNVIDDFAFDSKPKSQGLAVQERIALCFVQQKIAFDLSYMPDQRREAIEKLLNVS